MSVDQLIHFNSNEEYERSVFQFVQMTGNMSIKEAKHAMDGLVERTLAKQNFLTYRCGGGGTARAAYSMFSTPATAFRTAGSASSPTP